MKIAVVGATLQAGVLTALLSRYGNRLTLFFDQETTHFFSDLQDLHLRLALEELATQETFQVVKTFQDLPEDIECYLLCYDTLEMEKAEAFLLNLANVREMTNASAQPPLLINGSTFGLYGTKRLQQLLPQAQWAYLPDIIQEGNAIQSFTGQERLIIGVETPEALRLLKELFRPFFPHESQWLVMPILDAELTKLSISGMLATRISYMNDLANVAETIGVDISNIKQGLAADRRIGGVYLSPGAGFGGENFSSDILMLSKEVEQRGVKSRLLEQVWEINEDQKEVLFRKFWRYYETQLHAKTVAIWGASFKEETASTYNSPIHKMLKALNAEGVKIRLFDPMAMAEVKALYPDIAIYYAKDQYDALQGADALFILTAWKSFYAPDYQKMKQQMQHPYILDGRNIYDPEFMRAEGFIYEGVGR